MLRISSYPEDDRWEDGLDTWWQHSISAVKRKSDFTTDAGHIKNQSISFISHTMAQMICRSCGWRRANLYEPTKYTHSQRLPHAPSLLLKHITIEERPQVIGEGLGTPIVAQRRYRRGQRSWPAANIHQGKLRGDQEWAMKSWKISRYVPRSVP